MTLHDSAVFLFLMRLLFIPGESASNPSVSESANEHSHRSSNHVYQSADPTTHRNGSHLIA
jgi:hypothetical protein